MLKNMKANEKSIIPTQPFVFEYEGINCCTSASSSNFLMRLVRPYCTNPYTIRKTGTSRSNNRY